MLKIPSKIVKKLDLGVIFYLFKYLKLKLL